VQHGACDANESVLVWYKHAIRPSIVRAHVGVARREPACALGAPPIERQHSAAAAQSARCVRHEGVHVCGASIPSGSRLSDLSTMRRDASLCV